MIGSAVLHHAESARVIQITRSGAATTATLATWGADHIGYVRAICESALMLQLTAGDDLPACLCADYETANVRICRWACIFVGHQHG
jgi:hypothetical protein